MIRNMIHNQKLLYFGHSLVEINQNSFKSNPKLSKKIQKLTDEKKGVFADTFHSFRKEGINFEVVNYDEFYNIKVHDRAGKHNVTRAFEPANEYKIINNMITEGLTVIKRRLEEAAKVLKK